MSAIIVLDSGPLGMVTNPRGDPATVQCCEWLESLLVKGFQIYVPEIADYEVRRELLRADKIAGLSRLDQLKRALGYLPISTQAMLRAAEFWAIVRKQHKPTADDKALDGDVILAAQASLLKIDGQPVIIATTNVSHLSLFAEARVWQDIT
jgi:predicted nucleic acid-binding protein